MTRRVRVRFAPSPTGPLHIGGVRTALYNYLYAKKHNGDFILRIEDTDQNRLVPGAEQYIIEALKWMDIRPNEGVAFGDGPYAPYRQSDRKDSYRQYAEQLIKSGFAYYAFDTEEELEQLKAVNQNAKYDAATRLQMKNSLTLSEQEVEDRLNKKEHYVIRIKLPENEDVRFHDEIRGIVVVNTVQMDDKVLLKSDGMPTYHLANVCDDYIMQISHVIRGEEWLPSAPLHVLLYRYLGWEQVMPKFAHLPLLLKPDGNGKLSKRDGDRLGFPVFPLEWTDPKTHEISSGYREKGYLPEAVLNMLVFLGWNPGGTQEIFSKEELINLFSLEQIHKAGAKFDFEKAKWFNAEYIKKLSNNKLADLVKADIEKKFGHIATDYLSNVCGLVKERLVFLSDLSNNYGYLFKSPEIYDETVLSKVRSIKDGLPLDDLIQALINGSENDTIAIENKLKDFAVANSLKTGDLMKFIRAALVGELSGPTIPELILLLGRETSARRIENCFSQL